MGLEEGLDVGLDRSNARVYVLSLSFSVSARTVTKNTKMDEILVTAPLLVRALSNTRFKLPCLSSNSGKSNSMRAL